MKYRILKNDAGNHWVQVKRWWGWEYLRDPTFVDYKFCTKNYEKAKKQIETHVKMEKWWKVESSKKRELERFEIKIK